MSTSIEKLETGLSGDRKEIATTVDRIRAMMSIPADAPDHAIWGLAQVSVALNLNPLTGEVYLGKFNGIYQPIIGTMGYEKKAREQSDFHYDIEELDEQEMKKHRGSLYDPEDYGVRIELWNYAKASECKRIGIQYKPAVSYGFWFKKATEIFEWEGKKKIATGEYKPDNIPSSWSKVQVAEKRAIRNVLKRDYTMGNFEAAASALGASNADEFESEVYEVVEEELRKEERNRAPVLDNPPEEDEDGTLWAPERTRTRPAAQTKTVADVIPFTTLEEVEEIEGGQAHPEEIDPWENYTRFALLHDVALDGHEYQILDTLQKKQDGEQLPASSYGKMVARLGELGITDNLRPYALAILFGRQVNKNLLPPKSQSVSLYKWLETEDKGGDAQVVYMVKKLPKIIELIEIACGFGPNSDMEIPY